MNRREFLTILGLVGIGTTTAHAGRKPPSEEKPDYKIVLPEFMSGLISDVHITYLNETIPKVFAENRQLFPAMDAPPQYIVLNTLNDTLVNYGGVNIAPHLLYDEAMTLFDVQYLLATTRFSSVATPHRQQNLDNFGKFVYLKQHPQHGYHTPKHLLLEEMIHAQQDMTVMRRIIEAENLSPSECLHGQLKGISELGAHYYTDAMLTEPDYVFVLDDDTHCDGAHIAIDLLAERLKTTPENLVRALTWDADAYMSLDAMAMNMENKHIWQMITTWRYARDAEGNATDIAPAYIAF